MTITHRNKSIVVMAVSMVDWDGLSNITGFPLLLLAKFQNLAVSIDIRTQLSVSWVDIRIDSAISIVNCYQDRLSYQYRGLLSGQTQLSVSWIAIRIDSAVSITD